MRTILQTIKTSRVVAVPHSAVAISWRGNIGDCSRRAPGDRVAEGMAMPDNPIRGCTSTWDGHHRTAVCGATIPDLFALGASAPLLKAFSGLTIRRRSLFHRKDVRFVTSASSPYRVTRLTDLQRWIWGIHGHDRISLTHSIGSGGA